LITFIGRLFFYLFFKRVQFLDLGETTGSGLAFCLLNNAANFELWKPKEIPIPEILPSILMFTIA